MAVEDMEVYKRTEELMFRTYPAIVAFPIAEKFCLSQKLKNTFLEVLTYMSLGNDVKNERVEHLSKAEAYLHTLKVGFRVARYRKYIGKEFYRQISVELTEIGKMLGAWKRSALR